MWMSRLVGRELGSGKAPALCETRSGDAAPVVGAEGVDEFFLGELDGLDENLAEIGEGAGLPGLDVALSDGGEEAAESQAEIAGGEITAGEKERNFIGGLLGSAGVGFLAGVEVTELRIARLTRGEATAAIGEGEGTQRDAIVFKDRRHGILLKYWILEFS